MAHDFQTGQVPVDLDSWGTITGLTIHGALMVNRKRRVSDCFYHPWVSVQPVPETAKYSDIALVPFGRATESSETVARYDGR